MVPYECYLGKGWRGTVDMYNMHIFLLTHMVFCPTGFQQSTNLEMKLCKISSWL